MKKIEPIFNNDKLIQLVKEMPKDAVNIVYNATKIEGDENMFVSITNPSFVDENNKFGENDILVSFFSILGIEEKEVEYIISPDNNYSITEC